MSPRRRGLLAAAHPAVRLALLARGPGRRDNMPTYGADSWTAPLSSSWVATAAAAGTGLIVRWHVTAHNTKTSLWSAGLSLNGAPVTALTFAGQPTVTIPAGGGNVLLETDPLTVTINVGDEITIVTSQTPQAGGAFHHAAVDNLRPSPWVQGSDRTATGAIRPDPTNTIGFIFAMPYTVSVIPTVARPAVLGIGDSIMEGFGANPCYLERALGPAGVPYTNTAHFGESLTDISASIWDYRLGADSRITREHTDAIVAFGANDLITTPVAVLAQRVLDLARDRLRAHLRVWVTTVTPRWTSSDSFTTTTGQTPTLTGFNEARGEYNAWLRDGAPITAAGAPSIPASGTVTRIGNPSHPFTGVLDFDEAVTDAQGRWVPGSTDDGVHPNNAGAALIAGVVSSWAMTTPPAPCP